MQRRLMVAGLALIAPLLLGAGRASIQGSWKVASNPYESDVSLEVSKNELTGKLGCYRIAMSYEARDGRFTKKGMQMVTDGPCTRRDPAAAWAYWRSLTEILAGPSSYEIKGDRLTFVASSGTRAEFRRR